jgi:hypothetical protein
MGVQETERQVVIYDPVNGGLEPDSNYFNPKRYSLPATSIPAGINKHIEGMKLLDWENEEEDRERDGVKIVL